MAEKEKNLKKKKMLKWACKGPDLKPIDMWCQDLRELCINKFPKNSMN